MWDSSSRLGFWRGLTLGRPKAIESLYYQNGGLKPLGDFDPQQLAFLVMGTFLDDTAML